MRVTAAPRTAHDIRPSRGVPAQPGPGDEQATYARLSQLARERRHLVEEHELGQRRLDRIAMRLAEIDTQMNRLRGRATKLRDKAAGHPPKRGRR